MTFICWRNWVICPILGPWLKAPLWYHLTGSTILFFSPKNWQLDRIRGLIKFKCNGGVRVVEGEKTSWRELCAFYGFCVWLFSREVLTVVSGFGCCQSDPTTVKFPSSFHLRLLAPVTAAAQINWAPVMATAQINCFSIRSCKMATFYFIISFEFISWYSSIKKIYYPLSSLNGI